MGDCCRNVLIAMGIHMLQAGFLGVVSGILRRICLYLPIDKQVKATLSPLIIH